MKQNQSRTVPDIDWQEIMDSLEAQKCVLFLGNSAFKDPDGSDMDALLSRWLELNDPEQKEIRHHNPDGFLLLKKKIYKRRVVDKIRGFYNRDFPAVEEHLARIARIPFSLIVTLTYDNLLQRVFEDQNLDYQTDFYFKNRIAPEEFEVPTRERPMIYNLMGNIEESESLVLTHEDFFNYMESVFVSKSMHPRLKEEIHAAERFIFLGLPYEKWYFQMLLRILKLQDKNLEEIERIALKETPDPVLQIVYEEFKINFIPTEAASFVQQLYDLCSQRSLLKSVEAALPGDSPGYSLDEIQKLVVEDARLIQAIDGLREYVRRKAPQSELNRGLLLLKSRATMLRQRELRGTIDTRDLPVEQNQINEQVLVLISKARRL
jgi:hypothetical protein